MIIISNQHIHWVKAANKRSLSEPDTDQAARALSSMRLFLSLELWKAFSALEESHSMLYIVTKDASHTLLYTD